MIRIYQCFFIILQDTVEKKLSQMILDKKFHGMYNEHVFVSVCKVVLRIYLNNLWIEENMNVVGTKNHTIEITWEI